MPTQTGTHETTMPATRTTPARPTASRRVRWDARTRRAVRSALQELLAQDWTGVHAGEARTDAAGGIRLGRARIRLHAPPRGRAPIIVVVVHPLPDAPLPDEALLRRRFGLTPREAEVAGFLARRLTNKELAAVMGITPNTAWRHTERVMRKLGVTCRQAVAQVVAECAPGRTHPEPAAA
jgi:DNA-binding CsgD family transcriptional regulator